MEKQFFIYTIENLILGTTLYIDIKTYSNSKNVH